MAGNFDRHITVFSPEGRLFQLEYAVKAVKSSGTTAIGVCGVDTACVITQKKVPDSSYDASTITSIFSISDSIGAVCAGLVADQRSLIERTRYEAANFSYKNGYPATVGNVARRISDVNQVYTQKAWMRPYGCEMILAGIDEETGPAVYKCDLAGKYNSYKAVCCGVKVQETQNFLEKKFRTCPKPSSKEVIQFAISALQASNSSDFKPKDMEIGVVMKDRNDGRFFKLTEAEIEEHLNELAENN